MPPELAKLVAEGRLAWNGRKPALPKRARLKGDGPSASDTVIEDRGPR
jgi:hypothetical protein